MTTEVVLDDNREVVLANVAVTASGSTVVTSYGGKEVILVINVSGTVTGTTPTLTFTIQEVDPGDEVTAIGVSVVGAPITATGVQIIEIPVSRSSFFKVSWAIGGSASPTFNAVYATLVNKGAGASVLYDNLGNSVFGTAGSPGSAVLTVQGVSGGQPSPVSGTVTSNQGTAAALAGAWPVEVTDGTHTMPTADVAARKAFVALTDGTNTTAVKAASTAAAAADPSAVVALSPNSPLPTGSNTIGTVTAAQATAANLNATVVQGAPNTAANSWPVEVTDGTNVLGTSSHPVRTDPTGTTTQPVSGTVTSNQGTAAAIGGAWPTEITDGTHGPVAVKAANTAAAAADPSLVTAFSPNSPLPTGANTIGALTANQSVNLTQVGGAATVTGGTAGSQGVGGLAAAGAAAAGNPVQVGGVYQTTSPAPATGNVEPLQSDQAGNLLMFPGIEFITGAAWTSATAINTLQYQTGTTTIGQLLGASAVLVQLDQTTTLTAGAVTVQGTFDGINWVTIPAAQVLNPNTFAQIANPYSFVASTNQPILILLQGYIAIRLNLTSVITGTGSVTPYWSTRSIAPQVIVAGAGTAGTPQGGVVSIQGVSGGTTLPVTAAQGAPNTVANSWPTEITDGTHGPAAVKAASTAVAAADPSLAVGLSPNSPLPAGSNAIGSVTQGTAAALAGAWPVEVTDGTHTMPTADVAARKAFVALTDGTNTTAVKAASTAAVAADPSAVVALSPNSPLPAGTNSIGAVTQATAANLNATVVQGAGSGAAATFWYVRVTDGTNTMPTMDTAARSAFQRITDGTNTAAVKAASTAAAAADPSLVVALSPNSPLPTGANVIGALTANQSVNVAQVGGAATSTAASGVQKVGVVGNAGATLDGTLAAGTAPTDGLGTLAQYNTTPPAPTNAQTLSLQSDQSGNLLGFPGVQTKTGAAWTSATAINTLQFPTGTTTAGAPIGAAAIVVQLDQTTTLTGGAVTFQGTYDGSNWVTIPANQVLNPQSFAQLTNPYTFVASTNQAFLLLVQGFQQIRANLTTVITGTGSVTPFWALLAVSPAGATNEVQGMAPVGSAPVGNPVYLGAKGAASGNVTALVTGADSGLGIDILGNSSSVHSNATITTSGSTIITAAQWGVQQINLIVNVKAAPTGTTPTIQYTVQEIDAGDGATTFGNSVSTATISAVGVYTATISNTTSNAIKVSWTVTGTTPSFTQVYATVVSKASPASQAVTTAPATSTNGIALGYITTASKTNVALSAVTTNEQSANFTGSVSSGSAADAAAGTGARTISITWMNATGTTVGTETATLNGTTAVNLVTTTKCFIEKMLVTTVGTGGTNAGIITIFTGAAGAGTVVTSIAVDGNNRTQMGHHYVLSGQTCHITDMTGTTNSSNESLFTVQATSIPVANQPGVLVSDWVTGSQTNQTQRSFGTPVLVAGPARIQMFVAPGATASIQSYGSFDFYDQ